MALGAMLGKETTKIEERSSSLKEQKSNFNESQMLQREIDFLKLES